MTSPVRRFLRRYRSTSDGALTYVARARDAFAAGEPQAGREALSQALARASEDAAMQLEIAGVLDAAGMHDDALSVHRRLVERADPPSESVMAMSRAFVDGGSVESAIRLLAGALQARPQESPLRCSMAVALERAGRLTEAREQSEYARTLDPMSVEAHRIHGRLCARLGDTVGCVNAWRRVVALTGHADVSARTALGIALSQSGRHDEAIRELSDVAVLSESADAYANVGMSLLEAQRAPEALTALRRATLIDPGHAQAQLGVGVALLSLGSGADAIAALGRATSLAPNSAVAWYNLALAHRGQRALTEARRALVRAAALAPEDVEITALLEELAAPPTGSDAQITGDLTSFPLPDLIEFLRGGAKTGAVVIAAAAGAGLVQLDHGRVTSANAPSTVRLGTMLVDHGYVTQAALEGALAVATNADQSERVGAALLRAGLIDRARLSRVVLAQTLAALEEILGWSEGSFSFHRRRDDASTPEEPELISFDAQFVMMELMRIMDERGRRAPNTGDLRQ